MRGIVVGLVALAVAAAEPEERWHGSADLVVRGEVVQVSDDGGVVSVVLDRIPRGSKGEPQEGGISREALARPSVRPAAGAMDGQALQGERPPLALTFAPAGPGEAWAIGDRTILYLRRRVDAGDGPRWISLAPRADLLDAENPTAEAEGPPILVAALLACGLLVGGLAVAAFRRRVAAGGTR